MFLYPKSRKSTYSRSVDSYKEPGRLNLDYKKKVEVLESAILDVPLEIMVCQRIWLIKHKGANGRAGTN